MFVIRLRNIFPMHKAHVVLFDMQSSNAEWLRVIVEMNTSQTRQHSAGSNRSEVVCIIHLPLLYHLINSYAHLPSTTLDYVP